MLLAVEWIKKTDDINIKNITSLSKGLIAPFFIIRTKHNPEILIFRKINCNEKIQTCLRDFNGLICWNISIMAAVSQNRKRILSTYSLSFCQRIAGKNDR